MVIIRIFGGLGNQMFQYAFGEYLRVAGNEVLYDIGDYGRQKFHQGFELEKVFGLKPSLANKNDISKTGITIDVANRVIKKLLKRELVSVNQIKESISISKIDQCKYHKDMYFDGFWQNYEYVIPNIYILKKNFSFKAKLSKEDLSIFANSNIENLVSIHIRRGDYFDNPDLGCICNKDYYQNAIVEVQRNISNPKFVFFSDDIEWCKKEFSFFDAIFVDWNTREDSFRDMLLMTKFKHHVMSNSTFCWWGTVLSDYHDGVNILPQKWNAYSDGNLLALPSWIKIDTYSKSLYIK